MWEFFPKLLEVVAVAISREQLVALFREHPFISVLITLIVLLGLSFAVINGIIEFNHKLKEWTQSRRGRFAMGLSFGAAAVIACFVVYTVPAMLEPTPEFILTKTEFVGGPMTISWKYNTPQKIAAANKVVRYELQSATDRAFTSDLTKAVLDTSYVYFTNPQNGRLYWRVRPVLHNGSSYEPLSNWSQLIETAYYHRSIERIKETGSVNIYISNSNYQGLFKFINNGAFGGLDIELIKAVVADLPRYMNIKTTLTSNLVPLPWIELLDSPAQGRADIIISTITKQEQRELKHKIKFSKTYYCTTQSVLYRSGAKFESILDLLKSSRLGVQKGTTSEDLVTALRKYYKIDVQSIPFEEIEKVISAVVQDDVDFAITDTPFAIGAWLRSHDGGTRLAYREFKPADFPSDFSKSMETDEYGIAARKGDEELLGLIDQILDQMKKDGRLARLMQTAMAQFTADQSVTGSVPKGDLPAVTTPWLCPQ